MAAPIDPHVRAALTELVLEFARRVDVGQGHGAELLFRPDGYYEHPPLSGRGFAAVTR